MFSLPKLSSLSEQSEMNEYIIVKGVILRHKHKNITGAFRDETFYAWLVYLDQFLIRYNVSFLDCCSAEKRVTTAEKVSNILPDQWPWIEGWLPSEFCRLSEPDSVGKHQVWPPVTK